MPKTHFENPKVYQLSEVLADDIWDTVLRWDHLAKNTVGQQIVKSADGIGACIAEGSGRGTARDNRRFIGITRGSLYGTKHWLRRAFKRKLLTSAQTENLRKVVDDLAPALNGYRRSVSTVAASQRVNRSRKTQGLKSKL